MQTFNSIQSFRLALYTVAMRLVDGYVDIAVPLSLMKLVPRLHVVVRTVSIVPDHSFGQSSHVA